MHTPDLISFLAVSLASSVECCVSVEARLNFFYLKND